MNADLMDSTPDPDCRAVPAVDSPATDPAALPGRLAAATDQYRRLAADFENFRKRTRRDSERQAAVEKDRFIQDLLPVLDNLERALTYEETRPGVEMVLQQLGQLLCRHGIVAVEDKGRPFDPHGQEAVLVRHDPMQPDQVVLEVTQRGYCRGDQIFRPAKVIVNDLRHFSGDGDAR